MFGLNNMKKNVLASENIAVIEFCKLLSSWAAFLQQKLSSQVACFGQRPVVNISTCVRQCFSGQPAFSDY